MQIKIPAFLSKRKAACKSNDEVRELVQKYKNWVDHDVTQEFLANLEHQILHKMQEDEKEVSFISRFQFNYKHAHSRGFREALRGVVKQFKYEV